MTKHVFFLGMGGIGMSALARHLHSLGHVVGGYDAQPSPLLDALQDEGLWVTLQDDPEVLPPWAREAGPDTLTVVYTPAMPAHLSHLLHFKAQGHVPMKRAQLLGQLTAQKPTLAVAGTHGKTTTSNWLAAMLWEMPDRCHAFLGGIDHSHGTNHLTSPSATWHVVEADEFDRSFHHLHPTHAAITTLDPDHLDVYGTSLALEEAFAQFGQQTREVLLLPMDLEWPHAKDGSGPKLERFALCEAGQAPPADADHLAVLHPEGTMVEFRIGFKEKDGGIHFHARPSMPGKHNAANALVAASLAHHAGASQEVIARVVSEFQGVHRRMDVHLDTPNAVYIDDYAHHPTELRALIDTVKGRWPRRHLTLVFQPHLYSRTRDFMQEFSEVLALADRVILLPIYPAREAPIPGVDAQWLFDNISTPHKQLCTSDSIFGSLKACPVDVLVTAGAGDIDRLVPKALQHMQGRRN